MAEITSAGYESIRDLIQGSSVANWKFIELQTSGGTKAVRKEIDATGTGATFEARVNDGQTIVVKFVVRGSDIEGTLPVTVTRSILKSTNSDVDPGFSIETLDPSFTFNELADQLTIYHQLHVPHLYQL